VTTELITCQGFGGVGLSGGSSSRLASPKEYLWLSILHVIIHGEAIPDARGQMAATDFHSEGG